MFFLKLKAVNIIKIRDSIIYRYEQNFYNTKILIELDDMLLDL